MQDDLRLAFQHMFSIEKPHDFQIKVADLLLNQRRSVILQAPTGSGKTWTALFPFLHAWQTGLPFPRKCLYAVPLRVLATQFIENARHGIDTWPEHIERPRLSLHTGEQPDAPTFEHDLIFTTIDQVLSSALSVPYSLGYKRSNMNAGAVFSSFLVFDELHLFPVEESKAQGALVTLIELLKTFGDAMPFLLMTATLSNAMVESLVQELGTDLVEKVMVEGAELETIESQQKTRRYHTVDAQISAFAVISQHQHRSMVICNQVQRAMECYDELIAAVEADPAHCDRTEVKLLHARFVPAHRRETEDALRETFAKVAKGQKHIDSRIIVATQVVEVGLDITCERLHTELAPANSIIQRAGRCARYKDEIGDVFIYRLPDDVSKPYLPYDAPRSSATWEAFSAERLNGQALTFGDEQEIVTQVHNPADEELFKKIITQGHMRRRDMYAAMFRGSTDDRHNLIRKVDSRTLIVHPNPQAIQNPFAWRGFSIFHGTLRKWLNELQDVPDWVLRFPVDVSVKDQNGRKRPEWNWDSRASIATHIDQSPLFVVHPDLVAYDKDHGLRLLTTMMPGKVDIAELQQEPEQSSDQSPYANRYELEDYPKHIKKMLDVYYDCQEKRLNKPKLHLAEQTQLTAERLERSGYLQQAALLERAALLAIALHDVGKLQIEWQDWAHAYQREIGETQPSDMMIVHTHNKPLQHPHHKVAEEKLKSMKRPPHASEGAWASWPIIVWALGSDVWLSRAVFTAIARHHAPFSENITPYILDIHGKTAVEDALKLVGSDSQFASVLRLEASGFVKHGAMQHHLIEEGDMQQWLVYALIVRVLRLCDGHSLEGDV